MQDGGLFRLLGIAGLIDHPVSHIHTLQSPRKVAKKALNFLKAFGELFGLSGRRIRARHFLGSVIRAPHSFEGKLCLCNDVYRFAILVLLCTEKVFFLFQFIFFVC